MSQTPGTSFKTSKLFRALSAQASINCSKFSLVSVSNCFPSKRIWEILRKKKKEQITFNWKIKGERYKGKASQGDQPYFSLTLTSLSDFKTDVFFRVAGVPPPPSQDMCMYQYFYPSPGIFYVCFWPISTPHSTQVLDRPYTGYQHSLSAL